MEYGSMACCSRGQLLKHCYTIRLMSCISTDACCCCAGTYSVVTGARNATVCVPCGAGESRMPQAPHVMPAYPT
jgi:hypothetical protein